MAGLMYEYHRKMPFTMWSNVDVQAALEMADEHWLAQTKKPLLGGISSSVVCVCCMSHCCHVIDPFVGARETAACH